MIERLVASVVAVGLTAGTAISAAPPTASETARESVEPPVVLTAVPSEGLDEPVVSALPLDTRPSADGLGATVLVVAESGVWELSLGDEGTDDRRPRRWRAGIELPAGFFGPARYLADGTRVLVGRVAGGQRSQALLKLTDDGFIPWEVHLADRPILDLLSASDGGLWVAYQPAPRARGASLERIDGDRVSRRVTLPSAAIPADWVEGREGDMWLATGLGLIEVPPPAGAGLRGTGLIRRSTVRASRVVIDGSSLAVAGSGLARFDGERLARVAPCWSLDDGGAPPILGSVLDLAVISSERWLVLYRGGRLAIIGPESCDAVLLGPAEGVPAGATRLLYEPITGTLIFGGRGIGIAARRDVSG